MYKKNIVLIIIFLFNLKIFPQQHPIWPPSDDFDAVSDNFGDYLNQSETYLRNIIDTQGKNNADNIEMVYVAFDFASLYHRSRDLDYAYKAAVILDEFANVFPQWQLHIGTERGYSMWWDDWFHRDLGWVARYLPQAYDIIANSGVYEQNNNISKNKVLQLFNQIINVDLKYPLYMFNSAGTRPLGLLVFGRVLNDPELVHLAYWYYNRMMHESFSYDGFWYEGSYDYMTIITRALLHENYAYFFNGYSDPADYTRTSFHKWDPTRLENVNLSERFQRLYDRMDYSLWNSAMPDKTWPVINETSPYPIGYNGDRARDAKKILPASRLFGGFGHAALITGNDQDQAQARLDFSPAFSHFHRDALHLIYFDKNHETIGGTGYVYTTRNWNASTLNQNLLAIDGKNQVAEYWTDYTNAPYTPETGRTGADLTRKPYSDTNLHNNIVLYEDGYKSFKNVQVVEVDATNAYRNIPAEIYQRMLAMVKIDNDNTYLVDFFYAKGGSQYDWLLHGGHTDYHITSNNSMNSATGTLGKISLLQRAVSLSTWQADLNYEGAIHRTTLLNEGLIEIYTGIAPNSREEQGNQEYLIARKTTSKEDLTGFYAVHETFVQNAQILEISPIPLQNNSGVYGIQVNMEGKTDYLVHTLQPNIDKFYQFIIHNHRMEFNGKFLHIRFNGDEIEWIYILDGTLNLPDFVPQSIKVNSFSGNIIDVLRQENGDSMNAFVTDTELPNNNALEDKTLIIKWGNGWTWGYKIKSVDGNIIITNDEPGFSLNQGQVIMDYCPAGIYPAPVTYKITGSSVHVGDIVLTTSKPTKADTVPPMPPELESIQIVE